MPSTETTFVDDYLEQSVEALRHYSADPAQHSLLHAIAGAVTATVRGGGKLLIAGNGGSAGDAQHLAAEFTGRMLYDRPPMAAMALHVDGSALTAVGNDYGYAHVFERQVQAMARPGDMVWGLSTSGQSENVVRALAAGRAMGLRTIAFTGAGDSPMAAANDFVLRAPSAVTPIIQQIHMVAGHLLCALVERAIHPRLA